VGKSIEVLPYSTEETAREHFIALSIKTALTLVKIGNDASNIQLKFTGNKIELVIVNICLLVNTVTKKGSKKIYHPLKNQCTSQVVM
jgi:hypothetical protein